MGLDDRLSRKHCGLSRVAKRGSLTMTGLLERMHFFLGVMTVLVLLILATSTYGQTAGAPNTQAAGSAPTSAQAAGSVPVSPDGSVVDEQTLLQQSPRIEGRIDILNETASVLMQPAGRVWRYFHEVILHWTGTVVIIGVILALAIYYLFLGPLRISAGRSGIKVLRYNAFERFSHWLTAVSFVLLALTGLNITFGKYLLLPVIGPDAFTTFSEAAKYVHNFVSFAFVLGLVLIIAMWMKDNVWRKVDFVWLKEGGGFIPSKHPTAGRFNAGEKLVFWLALTAGIAVSISGYLLLFPFYVTNIAGMQLAQVVHGIIGMLFIALIIGHIYIGTLGMEGAFEAMGTGSVDLNWAKEHHGLWLDEQIDERRVAARSPPATPAE
jgi:formate dehydrogenase subunit gamma